MRAFFLTLLVAAASAAPHEDGHEGHHYGAEVGTLRNYNHGIAGKVYAKDERTLFIKDFEYDGAGPDAFFWVGTQGKPSAVGTILPYPFKGKFYEYEDGDAPILEGRFDKVDITLTLPDDLKTTDLKWLSVWCRAFKVNFGDVYFPADLSLDADGAYAEGEPESSDAEAESEAEAEAESGDDHDHDHDLPPPLLPPDSNAADRSGHSYEDADAEGQAEGEGEPEQEPATEPESSATAASASAVLVPLCLAALTRRW